MDDEFNTIIDIVDYLGADVDSPPFKPYKNTDSDHIFGDLNFYLKLDQTILDNSGYLADGDTEAESADIPEVIPDVVPVVEQDAEPEVEHTSEVDVATEDDAIPAIQPAGLVDTEAETGPIQRKEVMVPQPKGQVEVLDFEEPTEELIPEVPDVDAYVADVYDAEQPEPTVPTAAPVVDPTITGDDELYLDNLKLIAKGVDNDALEIMRMVHSTAGIIVPLTFVRLGSKVLVRTNGDQESFDEHYETVRAAAEAVFMEASSVTATKNNVQVLFGE